MSSRRSTPPPSTRSSPTSARSTSSPWLYRIARNRSLNHLRRASAVGVDTMDTHFAEHGMTTSDKVMRRESFHELIGDVHELPESQRTALLLREIEDLSYDQIAVTMETTVPSVKSLLVQGEDVARRCRRGPPPELRRGTPRARRRSRGPGQAQHRRAPPHARVQALHGVQEDPQGQQQGPRRAAPARPGCSCSRNFCSAASSARLPPRATPPAVSGLVQPPAPRQAAASRAAC